jgi:hypothetical protein
MRRTALGLVAAGVLVAASTAPALAQIGVYVGPGGIGIETGPPGYYYYGPGPYYRYYDYAPGYVYDHPQWWYRHHYVRHY